MNTKTIYTILSKLFPKDNLDNTNHSGYAQVHCPFHNDNHASAGVNPLDGFFQCFTCGVEYQFKQLLQHLLNTTNENVINKLISAWSNNTEPLDYQPIKNNPNKYIQIQLLGIKQDVINLCNLLDMDNNYLINIPITIDGMLLGYKHYTPKPNENQPKSIVSAGVPNGTIIPFDVWKLDNKPTLICEGEKDMLIARSYGFNAITLIGGCKQLPLGWENYFKDREIVIAYDNDNAGKDGAKKLANHLYIHGCKKVKVLTNYYEVIKDNKEDIYDFFRTYQKTALDLQAYINATEYWTQKDTDELQKQKAPYIRLEHATNESHILKQRTSTIQVRAIINQIYSVPKSYKIVYDVYKIEETFNTFYRTDTVEFSLENDMNLLCNYLYMTDAQWAKYLQAIMKTKVKEHIDKSDYASREGFIIPSMEEMDITPSKETIPIYKSLIGPYIEHEIHSSKMSKEKPDETFEIMAISLEPLQTSKIYTIEYQVVPIKSKKGLLQVAVHSAYESNSSIEKFEVTFKTKQVLDHFKVKTTIQEQIATLYNAIKYNDINHLNYDLWLANELTFHSCLWFKLNNKLTRGTIYTNIIGDTRTGKSEIAQYLVALYNQGKFVNAKLSTVDSLIGGSDKRGDEMFIKAGVIPRNNRSLVVMEELHGLGNDYFKRITEVKSSGKVSINRVSGELSLECITRLIEISNPPATDSMIGAKPISDFADGVSVIKTLILNPEDIARNDIYVIVPRSTYINPFDHTTKVPQINKEYYEEKIKWVWSRTADDIIIEPQTQQYIWNQVQEKLNSKFDTNGFTILGSEGHIKVAKMSIALASMLCSTYDYQKVVVTNAHVDFIIDWLIHLYSGESMRIDKYVQNERSYYTWNDQDIETLRQLFIEWPNAILHLEQSNDTNKDLLIQFSGKKPNETGPLFTTLTINKFIKVYGMNKIVPTTKFRKVIQLIDRSVPTYTNNNL